MKELYVGIDPSINSTGVTINIWEDNSLFTEVFYIIKGNKLTKKEQKVTEDDDLKAVIYLTYEKIDIKDADDSHELELIKTKNLLNIVNVISNIITSYSKYCDKIYVGMEGLSYGSSVRTRSIYELAGLNYLIRNELIVKHKCTLYILPPTEVKKFATGIGNCSKDAVINVFSSIFPHLLKIPKIDDIADSWFICNYVRDIVTKKEQSL